MKLRVRQLEAFQAVAQFGNMTHAAESLGISQPAVSRLLSDFKDTMGLELFERKSGQLVVTQDARFLLSHVNHVLDGFRHIEELRDELTDRSSGHIRVTCLPGFATSHMPRVLSRFLEDRPNVTITLEPDRPERILEWILGQQYDCGITDSYAGHPAIEREFIQLRTVCIFPKGHRFEKKDVITPHDMAEEPIIHTRRDSQFYQNLNDVFQEENLKLNTWIEIRQFTAACELVALGKGVSVVSELDAVQYLDRNVEMRPFSGNLSHDLSILWPVANKPSLLTLEFIQLFRESIESLRID